MKQYRVSERFANGIHDGKVFTMGAITSGSHFTLRNKEGAISVPIKHVVLIEEEKDGSTMAKNPQHSNKQTLLKAVDSLNETCSTKLRVSSKTVAQILEAVATALADVSCQMITENLPQEPMAEFVNWGLLEKEFFGEEVPDGLEKALAVIAEGDGDFVQAETCKMFTSYEVAEEDDDASAENEEDVMENVAELKDTIKSLTNKIAKAEAKGKVKKVVKLTAELDAAKAELMATKKPEPEPEPEVNPRIQEIEDEIKALTESMPTKKKKAKKQQAKITALAEELASIVGDNNNKKEDVKPEAPKKKAGGPARGAGARANREIPATISWPKHDSVTGTIVSFCQKKPRTLEEILAKLVKVFPNRAESGMKKTVGALVGGTGLPLPLHYGKGIPCEIENDGSPEKTVFIPVTE